MRCDRQKWEPAPNGRVCSKHFLPEDFDRSSPLKIRLQKGAVPTLLIPHSAQQTLADPGAGGHGYCFVPAATSSTVSEAPTSATVTESPSPPAPTSRVEEDTESGPSGPLETSKPSADLQNLLLKQPLERMLNRLKRQSLTPTSVATPKRRKQVMVAKSRKCNCPRNEIQPYHWCMFCVFFL